MVSSPHEWRRATVRGVPTNSNQTSSLFSDSDGTHVESIIMINALLNDALLNDTLCDTERRSSVQYIQGLLDLFRPCLEEHECLQVGYITTDWPRQPMLPRGVSGQFCYGVLFVMFICDYSQIYSGTCFEDLGQFGVVVGGRSGSAYQPRFRGHARKRQ